MDKKVRGGYRKNKEAGVLSIASVNIPGRGIFVSTHASQ